MGPLRLAARAFSLALLAPLAGCYTPARTSGHDLALSLYRAGRDPSGSLSMRPSQRAAAPASLSADEAVALARDGSARLAERKARSAAARAAVDVARAPSNPQLRVNQLRLDQWLDGKGQARPAVRFNLGRPGELDARAAAAEAVAAEAAADEAAEAAALEAEIRWLFDDALLLSAETEAAERRSAARAAIAARTRDRMEAREALSVDDALASLASVEADHDSAERKARRDEAIALLLDRLGLDPGARPALRGAPLASPPRPLPDEQTVVEAALKNHAAIAAAAARIDGADARAYLARSRRLPWFSSVDVGYQIAPGVAEGLGWTAQTAIELPLFTAGGNEVRAADASLEAERRALASEAERIARDVRARLREARQTAALYEQLALRAAPALKRAEAEAARALEGHSIDALRSLAIEEQRAAVELRLLRALRAHRAALSALYRASGGASGR